MAKKYFTWDDLRIKDIVNSEVLSKCSWLNDFIEEKSKNPYPKLKYSAFNLWIHKELKSKYVNVNKEGFRIVINNQRNTDKKLFIFGDSVIFGECFLRDKDTLPSIISNELSKNNKPYEVSNYAQTGYTIMNQLALFTKLLSVGKIPDRAFFYFGINEVYVKCLLGLEHIAIDTFEKSPLFGYSFKKYFNDKISQKFTKKNKSLEFESNKQYLDENLNKVFIEVKNIVMMLKSISNMYNITIDIFLIPSLFTVSKDLSMEENQLLNNINERFNEFKYLFDIAHTEFSENNLIFNMSNIYDDIKESIFLDFCHTNHIGQEVLAIESIKKSEIFNENI